MRARRRGERSVALTRASGRLAAAIVVLDIQTGRLVTALVGKGSCAQADQAINAATSLAYCDATRTLHVGDATGKVHTFE